MERLFDHQALANDLAQAMADRPDLSGQRAVAAEAEVSTATITRALRGYPDLGHENALRLRAWIDKQGKKARAA